MLWTAAAAAALAWPIGHFVAVLLSVGQDGPGSALAQTLGGFVTLIIWAISTAVIIWNPGKGREVLGNGARTSVVLSVLFLPAVTILSAINDQNYDLRVMNETGARIDGVTVRMVGKRYSFGVLGESLFAAQGHQQDRPKGIAEISWSSEDGQSHVAEVDMSDLIPRRYDNGVLTFVIQADEKVRIGFFIKQELPF